MFNLPDDPYARLGVSQDAQIPEIRQAHRKLVLKCHPDKVSDPEQKAIKQEEFQKVQRAYEMLSDSKERQKYDDMARANEMEKSNARIRAEQAAYSSRTPPRRESNAETHHYNVRMAEPRFERSASSYGATPKSNPAYASGRTPPRSYDENIYSSSYDDGREHRSSRKAGGGASSYERDVPSSRRAEESDKRSRKEADRAWDRQREKAEKDASRRKAEEKERGRREKEKDKDRRKKKEEDQQKERKRDGEEKRTRHRSPYQEPEPPLSPIIMEARYKEEKSKSKANTRAKVVDPAPAPVREAITEDRHRVKQDAHLEFAAQYLQTSRNKVVPGPVRSKTYHPSMDTRYAPPVPTPPPAASAMAPPPPPIPGDDEPVKRSSARRSSETPRSKLSSSHRKSSRVVEDEPRVIPGFKKFSSMPTQRHSPPEVPESPPRMHRSQTDSYSRPMPGPHPGLARAQTWFPATAADEDYRDSGRSKHHHTRYHSDEDYDEYSEDERYNSRRPTRHHSPEAPKTKFRYTVEGNKTIPVRSRAESPRRGYKAAPYYSHDANSGRPMASYESYEQPAAYFSKVKYAPKYDVDDVAYSTTSEAGYRMTEPPQVFGY